MIIISPGETSLGSQLSPSFKVMLFLFFSASSFLDNVQPEPNEQEVSGGQGVSRNRRRVPPPAGPGVLWGAAGNAERQSEASDAAAHTLAVAS